MKDKPYLPFVAVALAAALIASGWFLRGCSDAVPVKPEPPPVVVPEKPKPDRVVYVYEKDSGSIPSAIAAGLDKLNRAGIVATAFEDDSTDGTNEVPEQYKVALDAARLAGLPPVLVVLGKGEVLTIANGGTEAKAIEELLEAVK